MPNWRRWDPEGGEHVLVADRGLPPADRVTFRFRNPTPTEVARFEQSAGYLDLGNATIDGRKGVTGGNPRWISNGPTNSIKALLLLLTDVVGPGPDGLALVWPSKGTDAEKEAFLGRFSQVDLYEVAEACLERGHVSEELRGN